MKKIAILLLFILMVVPLTTAVHSQEHSSNTVTTKVGNPPAGPAGGAPAPDAPNDIVKGIADTFGITMVGFGQNHLQWTWERLHEAGPGFTNKLKGSVVQATSGGISYKTTNCFGGGTTLFLGQYQSKEFFKFILVHEFGHVFQGCNPRSVTKQVEQMNAYDSEGGISFYAKNATVCFPDGSVSNYNEDYADMLAYYIDQSAGFGSGPTSCGGPSNPPNPYTNGGFPKHKAVAQGALQ